MATSKIHSKADYVIEQGTSGFWNYRKWNSGIAECWGETTQSNKSMSAWGTGYSFDTDTVNYPSGLFISPPNCIASGSWSAGNTLATQNSNRGTKSECPQITFFRPSAMSGTGTAKLHFQAIGRWK